eukprot:s61_g41.t1
MFSEEYHAVTFDYEHPKSQQQNNYQRECQRLVNKFRKELRDVQQVIKPGRQKCTLFEVMCSHDSEVTRQCQQLGNRARRFVLSEGDLSTIQARRKLFAHLIADQPEHLWYSPECAPWCRWSSMNMALSAESLSKVLEDRWQKLWQVALGIVLFEHQVTKDQHFHLEQPDGSVMLKLPVLGPLLHVALPCKFDMCTVGSLVDPVSKVPIRKRMTVCTTSAEVRKALDHRMCLGEHPHFPIAGSTKVDEQTMPVSKFAEKYPRKFARQIRRILGPLVIDHGDLIAALGSAEVFDEQVDRLKRYRTGMAEEVNAHDGSEPEHVEQPQEQTDVKVDGEMRQMIDLVSQKHGPHMMSLSQADQAWLLKLHRNLGHPGELVLDAAGEFCDEKIQEFAQKHNIGLKVAPPEAHWQSNRCERHGGILQEILTKMDVEEGINSYDQLEQALSFATQTKNQWSRHRGYPPELLVIGKMKQQPTSITSDPNLASHALASSDCADGVRFRAELAVRESARRAFVQVDNDQACRRAILQRTRPHRGKYSTGDWIMMWRE